VVGVEVGHQHQGQGRDAQPVQAPVDRPGVGAGVDEDSGSRPERQRDGVALSHVADDGEGVRWRPSANRLP
jgi:hypothetical protein